MKPRDSVLTIVVPLALEEELVDHLLEHPQWVTGFTITQVEGKGQAVQLYGLVEEVRGRSRRVQIQTVINRDDAQALIAQLKETLPNPEVAYWLAPALDFGRLA